jgi:hypothetical protein
MVFLVSGRNRETAISFSAGKENQKGLGEGFTFLPFFRKGGNILKNRVNPV